MRSLFLLSLLSLVLAVEWADPRVNWLGMGFDILENAPRQSLFVLNSPIEVDPDKKITASLLPEGVVMITNPTDNFHMYAEVIDQSENIKDLRRMSISGGVDFWKISGSFSYENKVAREFSSKINNKLTRVNSYTTLSKFNLQFERLNLTYGVSDRINKIAILLRKNSTNALNYATYLTDMVLDLYGTHIIVSQDMGGILSKMDSVDISSYQNSVDQTISASASASFASYFKISGQYSTEYSNLQTYSHSVTDTYVNTIGGEPWRTDPDYTYDNWTDSLKINPAIIGLKLIYILDVINDEFFKELTFEDLMNVRYLFNERLNVYLKNNYYKGCPDRKSSNYVSYANVFDKSLCNYQHSFNFGGLYTTSNNPSYQVLNTITEALRCPSGFTPHPLLHLDYQGNQYSSLICHYQMLVFKKCHYEYYYNTIHTDTYICLSDTNQTTGMYFGGIYTNSISNDITQDKTCPQKYIPYPIFHNRDKNNNAYICVAPYDSGAVVSVPFGGIFSSQYPNYMVGNKPVCGDGFERHPVGTAPVTELTYCIGLGSLDSDMKDLIPPGYGNDVDYQYDYYTIHEFENGTKVSVKVNPLDPDDYPTQVSKLVIDIFTNATGEEMPDCYLSKWATKMNINTVMMKTTGSSVNSENTILIVMVSIVSFIVVVSLTVNVLLYRKKVKKQYVDL